MHGKTAFMLGLSILMTVGACRRDKQPLTPQPPDWMEPTVSKQAQEIAPEATPVTPVLAGVALRSGQRSNYDLQLEKEFCYLFSAVGDSTVEELYLNVWDPEDHRVAKAKEPGPGMVMEYCPEVSGKHEFEVKVDDGHGHYMARVFSKQPGAPVAFDPSQASAPPVADTVAPPTPAPADDADALAKLVDEAAAASAPDADRVGDHFKGDADKTDWYVALEKGKCYWFIGAGDEGIKKLDLYLWDPTDKRLKDNKSQTNRVEIGLCPEVAGMYHFQAKIAEGAGSYRVGVFAKKK